MDTPPIEVLETSKQRILLAACLIAISGFVLLALRFVAFFDDALSGQPQYVRILTETMARELATQAPSQLPVIIEQDEHESCLALNAPSIPDEEDRGTIYLLTYSEQQHLTCITIYVVPADASRFLSARSFAPGEGTNYGPALLNTVKAVPEDRISRVYAAEYLRRLHWRYIPHFPLSPEEAASLTGQSRYSGSTTGDSSVDIYLDYGKLRDEVARRHRKINLALTSLLLGVAALSLFLLRELWIVHRAYAQYCRAYELNPAPRVFVKENITTKLSIARRQYFERQQQTQARLREAEKLRSLRKAWQEGLRSALPNVGDEQLRKRIHESLEHEPEDLEKMRSLWVEVQERTGVRTPTEKLTLLLESTRPFCTEEEFLAGQEQAMAILNKSGFRSARAFAIMLHDQFKTRAREMEELEKNLR